MSDLKPGQIVTVIDTGNYKASYSEPVPFKARVSEITPHPCVWVVSLETKKLYELYLDQISTDEEYGKVHN